jgi:guanylate kinase
VISEQSKSDEIMRVAAAVRSRSGLAVVISAPSGTGKTTVCEKLAAEDPGIVKSISFTTRLRRKGEVEGRHYHFVTRKKFEEERDKGRFVEWAEVYGQYYGTPGDYLRKQIRSGKHVVLDIDVQGARSIKKCVPAAVLIFLLPPSLAELENRLKKRGSNSAEDMRTRLRNAVAEFGCYRMFDYLVVNEKLEEAAGSVKAIIATEKHRSDRIGV